MLDMETRLAPVRHLCLGAIAITLLAAGPWVGWWTLLPLAISAVGFLVLGRGLADAVRPEYRIASAWVLSQALIAASIALTGGPGSPALAWLAIPTVTLPARFGTRGVLAGGGLTIAALATAELNVATVMVAAVSLFVCVAVVLALVGAVRNPPEE